MICIECSNPVQSLYLQYSETNIRLTRCPRCSQPCDVYVEYDKVLLALDLVLMKPAAFKHLIYNTLLDTTDVIALVLHPVRFYKSIIRICFLTFLFQVYLNWAYHEKSTIEPESVYSVILNCGNMFYQYSFFIVQSLLNDLVYHISVQIGLRYWGIAPHRFQLIEFDDSLKNTKSVQLDHLNRYLLKSGKKYHIHPIWAIIMTIILLSSIIKLLPVLIIIWPYDTQTLQLIMVFINITNNFFVFSLLHSCLGGSKRKIAIVVLVSHLLSYLISESGFLRSFQFIVSHHIR